MDSKVDTVGLSRIKEVRGCITRGQVLVRILWNPFQTRLVRHPRMWQLGRVRVPFAACSLTTDQRRRTASEEEADERGRKITEYPVRSTAGHLERTPLILLRASSAAQFRNNRNYNGRTPTSINTHTHTYWKKCTSVCHNRVEWTESPAFHNSLTTARLGGTCKCFWRIL